MVKIIQFWDVKKDGTSILRTYRKENFYVRAGLRPPSRFKKPIYECNIERLKRENSNLAL